MYVTQMFREFNLRWKRLLIENFNNENSRSTVFVLSLNFNTLASMYKRNDILWLFVHLCIPIMYFTYFLCMLRYTLLHGCASYIGKDRILYDL